MKILHIWHAGACKISRVDGYLATGPDHRWDFDGFFLFWNSSSSASMNRNFGLYIFLGFGFVKGDQQSIQVSNVYETIRLIAFVVPNFGIVKIIGTKSRQYMCRMLICLRNYRIVGSAHRCEWSDSNRCDFVQSTKLHQLFRHRWLCRLSSHEISVWS